MRRAVALLAAVLLLVGAAGCGGDGAEPGAPKGASLVLDFTPNAVHSGIYAARAEGYYEDEGIDLSVHQPGESTDAPKLLAAGRTEFAILDIHDLGIARERGLPLVGVMPLVQRPLAAILARADSGVRSPRELAGRSVGVTGLPSDEAVVASEVSADGGDPDAVDEVTIGFNAVSSLGAGRVDAATGFWNAEGVALRRLGVPLRIFKVDEYGAPAYPELVLTTSERTLADDPELVAAVLDATRRGYAFSERHPTRALADLLAADPALERADQAAQLRALLPALRPAPFDPAVLREWAAWDLQHGLIPHKLDVKAAFDLTSGGSAPEQTSDQIRQLTRHSRARHDQVDAGRLGEALGLDVDVRVVAQHRHADRDHRLGALDLEVGDDQLRLVERRLLERGGEDDVVAGRGQGRVDPAGQHQIGGDREDARHRAALDRAALAELLANALRAAPHLHHLGAALADLGDPELAADAFGVELRQDPGDGLRGRGVTEAVGDQQAPLWPAGARVAVDLRVDLAEEDG
jgi:putative hydroxymethylpyrimidine transport system substrate-binding protein